jgi:hypothetical protein
VGYSQTLHTPRGQLNFGSTHSSIDATNSIRSGFEHASGGGEVHKHAGPTLRP